MFYSCLTVCCVFLTSLVQATRSSERSITRPRSPPLPAHLKSAPPSRAASQRPTRAPVSPPPPAKAEPSRSRGAAKPPPPAAKPVAKATAKTPAPGRGSRVSYSSLERLPSYYQEPMLSKVFGWRHEQVGVITVISFSRCRHLPKHYWANRLDNVRES